MTTSFYSKEGVLRRDYSFYTIRIEIGEVHMLPMGPKQVLTYLKAIISINLEESTLELDPLRWRSRYNCIDRTIV